MAVPEKIIWLWTALYEFTTARGGDVISVRNAFPARINCAPDSVLPRELALRRVEIRTPPSVLGDLYEFEVNKVDSRRWIEPVAHVEVRVLHAKIGQRDEYEVALKPVKRGP